MKERYSSFIDFTGVYLFFAFGHDGLFLQKNESVKRMELSFIHSVLQKLSITTRCKKYIDSETAMQFVLFSN